MSDSDGSGGDERLLLPRRVPGVPTAVGAAAETWVDDQEVLRSLAEAPRLVRREEIFAKPSAVPAAPGLYVWYFDRLPPQVRTEGCVSLDGWTLAYAGISPKNRTSSQDLRKRLKYHYGGNAEGSTLRMTLGCLLESELDIQLRRVGSGRRLTFHAGE